jgi:hypothetical protein
MKKLHLIAFILLACVTSNATDHLGFLATDDSTKTKKKLESEGHWGGISLSAASMGQFQGSLEDYSATMGARSDLGIITNDALESWRLELNPFEYRQRILGEFVGFTTGLGFDWWHYSVDNSHILIHDEANNIITSEPISTDTINMQKNQLNAVFLRLPLLVSIRTARSGSKGLHVEAGFVGAYLLGNSYQYQYKQNGSTTNVKEKDFRVNPLQINARIGVGFKNVSLLGEASLLPFFDEVQTDQPTMHAFSLGMHFAFND